MRKPPSACRYDLLDGLVASLGLKPIPAKRLSDALKESAVTSVTSSLLLTSFLLTADARQVRTK